MASTAVSRHVVTLLYQGCGHINPMLAVCGLLVAADGALAVTVVVTEEWHALLATAGVPATLPDRVRFSIIPNVIPSKHGRGADHAGFIVAVHTNMAVAVERLLDRMVLEQRPDAIVADTYLAWSVPVGARHGILVCSLWTMAATFFWALYHVYHWLPVDGSKSEQKLSCKSLEQYVPGLLSVRLSDMKIFRANWGRPMRIAEEAFVNVRKAQCVLFTSFHELEPDVINRITQKVPCPVCPISHSIQHLPPSADPGKIRNEDHRSWLDEQQEKSVLYVSFGSYVSMPTSQLEEIAMALRDSGVRFFWVGRDNANSLQQQIAGHNKGMVVPWCDQLKVLCHPSVRGFLSHCGWNSMLETVYAGVPVIAFPVSWDQLVDGHIVADKWKIGIDLREQRSAIQGGSSSHRSLNGFVNDLAEGRLNIAETCQ